MEDNPYLLCDYEETHIKEKIIASLRCYQIAHIPEELRTQIKLFMKQVSSYETYEMSACGIFNYKLHFVISISVVIMKSVATMIQMGQHPYMRFLADTTVDTGPWNDTKSKN
ncbi:uncharacterized protein LOC126838895 [Adelges cooleyi]|uniref:uncharacterized protein LOC126838895 n=1 Tax=Adelges cooleyi TaxID=133065 RepID=UPI002180830E|nr:uncharacterized protein LOC126838895 [Adelges cooleyi]